VTRWRRSTAILGRLLPFVLAFLRDRRRWILFGRPARRTRAQHVRRADRLTAAIAALGPTFIKLAQILSARADIIAEPYLSAIGRLQDRVPPVPYPDIAAVFEAEAGRPPDAIFATFAREPVAAASLGQVHRARLGERDVAVKILRPEVERLVAIDLDISFRILYLLNILFPNHHVRALTNVFREFSVRVREEMDFREEARHMERFRERFAADRRVRAPDVLRELTYRRVLVMEWVDGDKIDRLGPRFEAGALDAGRVMETLIETYLRMTLIDGVLHADPHPGNILVQADGTIVFLDWGMVVQLSRPTRESILRIALAAGRDDLDGMINGMYALGMIDPGIGRSEIREAAVEILAIVERARNVGLRRVQELVQEIMDTFYTWPLMLPRELVYFFRAAALLEGIGLRYDPGFNGLAAARPVIRRMRGELLQANVRQPAEIARGLMDEVRSSIVALRDIVGRAEREEYRVRVHPRDVNQFERFMLLQVRRILLSVFALTTALIAAITFLALRSWWLLAGGLFVALLMFLVTLVLPTHLLENPLRHARGLREGD
jgi:predicted unusual protein kinase regulating ubiquinone biosynthesis (AarF/ABC1/UbiB family)